MVAVAVGGIGVAGSGVEVGERLGEEVACGWQAPSKMLISTKRLTKVNGKDLQQGELSIHPPKQILLNTRA